MTQLLSAATRLVTRRIRGTATAESPAPPRPEPSSRDPLVIWLRGTQEEMGHQHALALREAGGWREALEYYPNMPAALLASGFPRRTRRLFEPLARRVLSWPLRRLTRHRPAAFRARTEAFCETLDLPEHTVHQLAVMDVFQNAVGWLAARGLTDRTPAANQVVGCCSTLMVHDEASADGRVLHGRNFDFPGAGIWDASPAVVFCDPDDGLRYGFVTTRGADVPGVTCFNEAGITLTAHTRFHTDIGFDGACIVDLGHEIVLRAESIDDAVRIARERPIASTWGLAVSSARERRAVSIETTRSTVAVVEHDASWHACTNHYQTPAIADGEVVTAPVLGAHSVGRKRYLDQVASSASADGGLDLAGLQAALGSHVDPNDPLRDRMHDPAQGADDSPEPTACRACGTILAQPYTVASIVSDPEDEAIWVGVGTAPSSWGPWKRIPWSWRAPGHEEVDDDASETPRDDAHRPRSTPLSGERQIAHALYVEACRQHIADGGRGQSVRLIQRAAELDPEEPHYRFLAGVSLLADGEFEPALSHFDAALEHQHGTFRRGQLLFWASRVAAATGDHALAEKYRDALLELDGHWLSTFQRKAKEDRERGVSSKALRRVVPDYLNVGATP